MARRHREDLLPSFFAFQDVIVCLTGIMIVIALMLALDLLRARTGPATLAGPPVARAPDEATTVQSEIATLAQLLEKLRAEQKSTAARLAEQTNLDANAMTRELARLKAQREEAERGSRAQDRDREDLQRKLEEARRERVRIEGLVVDHSRERDAADLRAHRLTIKLPEESNGKPWVIVQLAADEAVVGMLTQEEAGIVVGGAVPDERVANILKAVARFPMQSDLNVLVLIKPSAFGHGDAVVDKLRERYQNVGSNPLDELSWAIRAAADGNPS